MVKIPWIQTQAICSLEFCTGLLRHSWKTNSKVVLCFPFADCSPVFLSWEIVLIANIKRVLNTSRNSSECLMYINVSIIIISCGSTNTFSFLQMRKMRNRLLHHPFKVMDIVNNKMCIWTQAVCSDRLHHTLLLGWMEWMPEQDSAILGTLILSPVNSVTIPS